MQISIIIINYNTFNLTSNCIRSVIQFTRGLKYEIILVDNASTECDPENFLEEFPQVKLIKNKINGGFAYGNNEGIRQASGEFILLLNSDTVLQEDSVSKAVAYLEKKADVGVVGCRLVFPDGKIQYTVRRFRTLQWELLDLFRFILFLLPYRKRAKMMLGKYLRYDSDIECDWIGGAFFLFRKKIIDQLSEKKLDERFFMYGEDEIWCIQIRQLGYKIMFFSGTTVVHIHGGSTDISEQISLRNKVVKHELEVMQLRKGRGLYYNIFKVIYVSKERIRNAVKWGIFLFTKRVSHR